MGRCPNCLEDDSINREKRYFGGYVCQCARCGYIFREDDPGNDPWTLNAVEKAGLAAMIGVLARKGNLEERRSAGAAAVASLDASTKTAMQSAQMFGVSLNSLKRNEPEKEQAKPRKRIQSKTTKVRRRIIL